LWKNQTYFLLELKLDLILLKISISKKVFEIKVHQPIKEYTFKSYLFLLVTKNYMLFREDEM